MWGILILLSFQWGAELLCRALHLPFPGSVLGMLGLTLALRKGWVSPSRVEKPADFLIRYLPLFFIPAGVLCLKYRELVFEHWVAITISCTLSTVLVLLTVGRILERSMPPLTKTPLTPPEEKR